VAYQTKCARIMPRKREKHVGGRLPPSEDKKDANNAKHATRKREKTVLIETRLETRLETRGLGLILEE